MARLVCEKVQIKSQAEVHAIRLDTETIRASSNEIRAGLQHLNAGHEEVKNSAERVSEEVRNLNVGTEGLGKQLAQMHEMLKNEMEEHRKAKEAEEEKRHLGRMGQEEWNRFSETLGKKLLGMLESNFEVWYRTGIMPERKKVQSLPGMPNLTPIVIPLG